MAYKQFSPHSPKQHDLLQWNKRDFFRELDSFKHRNVLKEFVRHNNSKKPFKIIEAGWVHLFNSQGHNIIGIEKVNSIVETFEDLDNNVPIQSGNILNFGNDKKLQFKRIVK